MAQTFAPHTARQFFELARFQGSSAACLFVDVIGAFDAVVRELMFSEEHLDTQVIQALQALSFGPDVLEQLKKLVQGLGALVQTGMDPHLVKVIAEAHQDTWFTTQGLVEAVVTKMGSRPGDPLGDIIYNFLATLVLKEI